MKRIKYLILHCAATREGQNFDASDVIRWHLAPRDLADGRVVYAGVIYSSRNQIPKYNMQEIDVMDDVGRGWRKPGYRAVIELDGKISYLIDNNNDGWVDDNEITNGVRGINDESEHICYIGGCDKWMRPKNTMTWHQEMAMIGFVRKEIIRHPDILVGGHNQFSNKACPSFDTVHWLRLHGIPEKNIYKD